MDPPAYLAGPEESPPPARPEPCSHGVVLEAERPPPFPKLVKPEGVKSRFWVHFMRYDLAFHPGRRTTARCDLCGKDISVKQGTGGLKNHLKFKHPEEYCALFDVVDGAGRAAPPAGSPLRSVGTEAALSPGGSTVIAAAPAKWKPRSLSDRPVLMDAERRNNEKHWLEMWMFARRELRDLRKDLRGEENENFIEESRGDIRVLQRRKSDYAEKLGCPHDFVAVKL